MIIIMCNGSSREKVIEKHPDNVHNGIKKLVKSKFFPLLSEHRAQRWGDAHNAYLSASKAKKKITT